MPRQTCLPDPGNLQVVKLGTRLQASHKIDVLGTGIVIGGVDLRTNDGDVILLEDVGNLAHDHGHVCDQADENHAAAGV